ncbi:3-phosphoglycerate dehydrogenase [Bradyrhizobium sp. SSBR45G]|uniref:hydroxyacid dehydrogenase n=1 Tax=unclassified Bradyrhizobium TaxID=2631580 RepID=UPI0023428DDF|nr:MULTISPECIES: hydroxyacid dehydrogenase [unclassified Bradyrhizobium]GLH75540.1 3-phosphoglycerate dehydrogenase [Bradyrhizobium sp. SSBR45G]GLH82673.1 3-phosphoglycerate dehydrogenase [Bradyrhizobium sp. SSBR45R]
MRYKLLITGPALTAEAAAIAARRGASLVDNPHYASPRELAEIAAREQPDGIIVRQGMIDDQVIGASAKLKAIAKHGVGYDNIDVEAADRRGIPVFVARGANSQSVAELAFALMFAVAREIPHLDARIKTGHWDKATTKGAQLFGRSLGVIGFGEIGRILVGLVQPLNMQVRIFDPYMPADAHVTGAVRAGSLDEILTASDVISLHCPLTPQTRNMIGRDQLARMRRNAILINTARGGLIDEAALFKALRDGVIAGAGLDSFAEEPARPDLPLLTLPNAVVTPHAGASTQEARDAMGVIAVNHVMDVLEGKTFDRRAIVNKKQLSIA